MFCPREPVLRWVIAVWLVRVLGDEPAQAGSSRFSDVDAEEWWAPYVETLADLGVTKGCDTEPLRFCPDESVTRAQMASFLVRAFALEAAGSAGFADTAGNTHEEHIDALAAARYTAGCAVGPLRYCPDQAVTRAEMATFLARALGLLSLPGGVHGLGGRPLPVGSEAVVGFDPFTTPTLTDIDLDRLAVAVETLDETVDCPPTVAPESLDDVAEVVRIENGCLLVEYEPLDGRTIDEVRSELVSDPTVHAVGLPPEDPYLDSSHHGSGSYAADPQASDQWHLDRMNAAELWAGWPTGASVIVAVIDSGVDATHVDLDSNVLTTGDACHRTPNGAHGTHVAGIVAAEQGNGLYVAGIAPNARILPIKIRLGGAPDDATCDALVPSVTVALLEAITAGADVINMSFGRRRAEEYYDVEGMFRQYTTEEAMVRVAMMRGAVLVAAGGNCGANRKEIRPDSCVDRHERGYPASYPGVIAVASTCNDGDHCGSDFIYDTSRGSYVAAAGEDRNDVNERSYFSTANEDIDIAAPGVGILSTVPESRCPVEKPDVPFPPFLFFYDRKPPPNNLCLTAESQGTSQAAPIVSGIVAHLKARFPAATVNQISEALFATAQLTTDHRGLYTVREDSEYALDRTDELGFGIVDPLAAIQYLGELVNIPTSLALEAENITYSAVEVGDNYSCGLRTDGTVACWGLNNANQASPPADTKFTAISAGQRLTCGLREDGTIQCWGRGDSPPDGEFRALTVDDNHGCAIKTDGLADCWVIRDLGSAARADEPAGVRFVDIAASAIHSCGLTDGRPGLRSVECWGDDEPADGISQGGQVSDRPSGRGFLEVAADSEYACAIRTNRKIICWGGDEIRGKATGRTIPPEGKFLDVAPGASTRMWHTPRRFRILLGTRQL